MLERMEIQGVCYVEVDDLHRNFLQANGGDFLFPCYPIHVQVDENGVVIFSFLAIQFMFKSTRMALVLC